MSAEKIKSPTAKTLVGSTRSVLPQLVNEFNKLVDDVDNVEGGGDPVSKATLVESATIDCSQGTILQMTITGNQTFSFSNLEEAESRVITIIGDYTVGFNAAYNTDYQTQITPRQLGIKKFVVWNDGTTDTPVYNIKDALDDTIVFSSMMTAIGADATIATHLITDFEYPFYINDIKIYCEVAPTDAAIIVDIKKNGSTIFSTLIQIDASDTTSVGSGTPYVFSSEALRTIASQNKLAFSVTQVGSTIAGQNVRVNIMGYTFGG